MSNANKPDTRKLILDTAEELLLTRSFSAFSYSNIASALGVKNAAIHYHFPSKTDLGVALVARFRRRFQRDFPNGFGRRGISSCRGLDAGFAATFYGRFAGFNFVFGHGWDSSQWRVRDKRRGLAERREAPIEA